MSDSRKDGRRRGGHRRMWPDVWSGRYHKVNFWTRHGPDHKAITARWERRTERQRLAQLRNECPRGQVDKAPAF